MAKSTGPCLEFAIKKEGAQIYFIFLPGNVSKAIFDDVKQGLKGAFNANFGGAYIKDIEAEFTTTKGSSIIKTIEIDHRMVLQAIQAIMGGNVKDLKVLLKGENDQGENDEVLINSYLEVKKGTRVVPFWNKNNNDMTTRRTK